MRVVETRDRIELRDVPGVLWVLGLVFVASGTFVLTAPLRLDRARGLGARRERRLWSRWEPSRDSAPGEFPLAEVRATENADRVRRFLGLGDVGSPPSR